MKEKNIDILEVKNSFKNAIKLKHSQLEKSSEDFFLFYNDSAG